METRNLLFEPLAIIDYEASSLSGDSYPIEVGFATWTVGDDFIYSWSSLIVPVPAWLEGGDWNVQSEGVHGISKTELSNGTDAKNITTKLNKSLSGFDTVWCDGGEFDAQWNAKLFDAANDKPSFLLGDYTKLIAADKQVDANVSEWFDRCPVPHRAKEDAERMMTAIAFAMGLSPEIEACEDF